MAVSISNTMWSVHLLVRRQNSPSRHFSSRNDVVKNSCITTMASLSVICHSNSRSRRNLHFKLPVIVLMASRCVPGHLYLPQRCTMQRSIIAPELDAGSNTPRSLTELNRSIESFRISVLNETLIWRPSACDRPWRTILQHRHYISSTALQRMINTSYTGTP